MEKVSELLIKGKLRLHQLTSVDPAECIVPFIVDEIKRLWKDNGPWQRACDNFFLEEINSYYPKSDRKNHYKENFFSSFPKYM